MLQGGGGVDPRMTVREAIDLHGRFHRDARDTGELLASVGLERAARTRSRRLSGGERQRLGLALALVGRPELLILDEPTAGLDIEARGDVRNLLAELRGAGVTILLTSHDLTDVERVADRIAIIERGRIVALGAPAELSSASSSVLRFRLGQALSDEDRGRLAARLLEIDASGALVDEGGGRYRLEGPPPDPAILAAVATWCATRGVLIAELRAGSATLEERYLEFVSKAGDEETSP